MKLKKILVVYYSRLNHTKKLAEELALKLDADIEVIKSPVSYAGFLGYQRALFQAIFNYLPDIKPMKKNISEYDLVIVGGPVWGSSLSSPVRSFLTHYNYNIKNLASFTTQVGNYGQDFINQQVKKTSGLIPIATLSVCDRELEDDSYKTALITFVTKIQQASLKNERVKTKNKKRFTIAHA